MRQVGVRLNRINKSVSFSTKEYGRKEVEGTAAAVRTENLPAKQYKTVEQPAENTVRCQWAGPIRNASR